MSKIENYTSYIYPIGHVFFSEDGCSYQATGYLGRGGQGEVYKVRSTDGREYAIKWYYPDKYLSKINRAGFLENLRDNVANGIPKLSNGVAATQFIWPLKMIKENQGSFGYLMNLFPEGYEPLKNVYMLRKKDPKTGMVTRLRWKSWFICITAALNITRAFEILHSTGLSYQDLNDGGVCVNMENGNVVICDCDNVSPDKKNLGIRGVMTYMAPEVVRGEKLPDRTTDEYSLAVILFRLFLHGHPMCGKESRSLHNNESMSQYEADIAIYGKRPKYCLSSTDASNAPDPVINGDVIRYSFMFTLVLMDAFERVFTKGIYNPSERLTATEWRKVLLEVRDSLILVNGFEQFYRIRKPKPLPKECRTLVYPHGQKVLCMPGKLLYKYHLDEYGTDFEQPVAKIIPTKKEGFIGLYNATKAPIHFFGGGKHAVCADQGRMPLIPGMTLMFEKSGLKLKVE